VFNQYYFDLLKKVKNYSRSGPEKVTTTNIRKSIKTYYTSYDKTAEEYREFFIKNTKDAIDLWESSNIIDIKTAKEWLVTENIGSSKIYENISLQDVESVIRSKKTFFYYFTLLCIFIKDITETEVSHIVKLLKNIKNTDEFEKSLETIEDKSLKKHLTFLLYLQKQAVISAEEESTSVKESIDDTMNQLETTSLGKLAKEIMGDIDINEVHQSLSGSGNILESLTNPDGGLTKLLGTVSQKMISKMASGEIRQETLLQDALQFSSQLQNMIPKNTSGMGGGFGDIANMMSQVGNLANMMGQNKNTGGTDNDDSDDSDDGSNPFNFSKMANMLNSMNNDGKKKQSRPVINKPELSRVAKAKQLRKKLEKQKREKETQKVLE